MARARTRTRFRRPARSALWLALGPAPAALLAGGVAFLSATNARAQTVAEAAAPVRVLLGPLQGRTPDLQSTLQSTLQSALAGHAGEVALMPAGDYAAAAERAGVSPASTQPRDVGSVADGARADVVLTGSLVARGRRGFTLTVNVLRGGDGERAGGATQEVQSLTELALVNDAIYTSLLRPMREARASRPALPAPPAPAPPPVDPAPLPPQLVTPPPQPAAPAPLPPPAGAPTVDPSAALGVLRVRLGGSLSQRYWRMPVLGESTPRGYDNAAFPEFNGEVSGLVRFNNRRMGAGLVAGGSVPLAIASRGYNVMGQPEVLTTSAYEVWGGLVFAYRTPFGGEFRAAATGLYHLFAVNTDPLPREQQLAPVSYLGGRGTLDGAVALFARRGIELLLSFGAELRIAAIGRDFGRAYGETSPLTYGVGGQGGVTVRLDRVAPGLAFGANAWVMRYRTTFSGRTDTGTGSDSVDDYLRFGLFASYDILTPRLPE